MAKANKLYAHIVLDRSGSMASDWGETLQTLNSYVQSLDEDEETNARVAVTMFDAFTDGPSIDLVRAVCKTEDFKYLSDTEVQPRGGTPLYDAVGKTIHDIGNTKLRKGERVALIVITDGHENASREFTREGLKSILDKKQNVDGWLVIYLGANQDAWAVGASFGTSQANTMSINTQSMSANVEGLRRSTTAYAAASTAKDGRMQASFTDEERTKAKS